MDIQYATSSFVRDEGNLVETPVINMYVESAPTEASPVLQSRKALEDAGITMGTEPVSTLYQVDGVLSGALFGISGDDLYSGGTLIGALDGSGYPSIVGYDDFLFATLGASLWGWDGTTLAAISFPDSANVTRVMIGASRAIAIRADSGRFYWTDVLGTTFDALDYATAEYVSDNLVDGLFFGDQLVLFGTDTTEFWQTSGSDPDLPFTPVIGRTFNTGIKNVGAVTEILDTFAWVTDDNNVCISSPDNIISSPGINELIEAETSVTLWSFVLNGTEFLALKLASETWVYNPRTSSWTTMETYQQSNWSPQFYRNGYFAASNSPTLLRWASDYTDEGDVFVRSFRAWLPINENVIPIYNLTLRCDSGTTPYLNGEYAEPSVELAISKDGGKTWGPWKERPLGSSGEYYKQVKWMSLGSYSYPGVLFEFRVTNPVGFRVSGLTVNGVNGGVA